MAPSQPRLRLNRALGVGIAIALIGATVGLGRVAPTSASPIAITSAQCDAQVNDTPSKLLPCIQQDDLWKHMEAFQAIADANPSPADGHPSRNSGEPGYKASVDYVAKDRSEERRVGKECTATCRSRWSPYH